MKIRVTLTIDVDPQRWADSNGRIVDADGCFTFDDVRDDVRSYFLHLAQSSSMVEETGARVTSA